MLQEWETRDYESVSVIERDIIIIVGRLPFLSLLLLSY